MVAELGSTGRLVLKSATSGEFKEVAKRCGLGSSLPLSARVLPDAANNRLLIMPVRGTVSKRFDLSWSKDEREVSIMLLAAFVNSNMLLPARGWVRELDVTNFTHKVRGESLAVSLEGGRTHRRNKSGGSKPAAPRVRKETGREGGAAEQFGSRLDLSGPAWDRSTLITQMDGIARMRSVGVWVQGVLDNLRFVRFRPLL